MADGARLKSDVSLRGPFPDAQSFVFFRLAVVLGAVALAFGLSSCARDRTFRERGLPADLPQFLGQIRALKVPAEVASVAWIPTTLRELDAGGTEIESIPFVPMGMERLHLRAAKNLKQLPTLPSSIRELDIRFTRFSGPWRFPHELESLALGGEQVKTLEGLSGLQLLELNLEDVPNLQSTAGLPASLQALSISGATFSQLIELPPQLKELRLENTQVRTVKGLPVTLLSMTLNENGVLDAELPHSLLSLTVSGVRQRLSPVGEAAFLNQLIVRHEAGFTTFPLFVRDLYVPVLRRRFLLPKGLRQLRFDGVEAGEDGRPLLPKLPASLEEIRWLGGADLRVLPASLKHLAIPLSELSDLSTLPPDLELESLDVSRTGIAIDSLPGSLLSLRYQFCGFNSVSGLPDDLRSLDLKGSAALRSLQALPPRLERLDVSETAIEGLPALPDALTELDISNTPISDLQSLKGLRRLRRLTVHTGQLKSLAGLPASVSELWFVNRQ